MTEVSSPPPLSRGQLALVSIGVSAILASAKFFAARKTGSVALLGASFDAVMDIGVTALAFGAIAVTKRYSERHAGAVAPPVEQWVAVLHTTVMLGVGAYIVNRAATQLLTHEMSMRMEETPTALATIGLAFGLEIWRAGLIHRAARRSGSPLLTAAALGFRMDIMTTVVAFLGLLTVGTGLQAADPIAAVIIGCVMLFAAARLLARSVAYLMRRERRAS